MTDCSYIYFKHTFVDVDNVSQNDTNSQTSNVTVYRLVTGYKPKVERGKRKVKSANNLYTEASVMHTQTFVI